MTDSDLARLRLQCLEYATNLATSGRYVSALEDGQPSMTHKDVIAAARDYEAYIFDVSPLKEAA